MKGVVIYASLVTAFWLGAFIDRFIGAIGPVVFIAAALWLVIGLAALYRLGHRRGRASRSAGGDS